jgi:hypothetical protein
MTMVFRVLAFAGMTMFFAGNTREDRTELSYKTQVLVSKIK